MKKFARKNQWIITALAVLIAVAGYLNFTGQEIDKNGWKSVMSLSGKETAAPQENADAVRECRKNCHCILFRKISRQNSPL